MTQSDFRFEKIALHLRENRLYRTHREYGNANARGVEVKCCNSGNKPWDFGLR